MRINEKQGYYLPMIREYSMFDVPAYNGFNNSIIGGIAKTNSGVTINSANAGSYVFDGSSNISFGNSIGNFADDFKIFCAFKTGGNVSLRQTLISKRAAAANTVGFEIYINGNTLQAVILQLNGGVNFVTGSIPVNLLTNSWYEFRFEFFKNTAVTIYLIKDGTEIGSVTISLTLSFTMSNFSNFTLGRISDSATNFLTGEIGFVALFGLSSSLDVADFNSHYYGKALMSHLSFLNP